METEDVVYVADVRRCLSHIRKVWLTQTINTPLLLSDEVSNDMTIARFAFRFVLGHHARRPGK